MGQRTTFRDLLGFLKDKASLSKAALFSKSNKSSLHLTVLQATSHQPWSPPLEKHVTVLLSFGDSTQDVASNCIKVLMHRLHKTHNPSVAFKCLINVHFIIRRGSFILQDQLSIYSSKCGGNNFNLSNFFDYSSPNMWSLSLFIRWYARVLQFLLLTSGILGSCSFCNFSCCPTEKGANRITALSNGDLLKEIDVLVKLFEEISTAPEVLKANKMVYQAMTMLDDECNFAQKELFVRISEIKVRRDALSFVDLVELICVLRRLENCKERIMSLFLHKKGSIGDNLWNLIKEVKEKIGEGTRGRDYGELKLLGKERKGVVSKSARFGERVIRLEDSVWFASGRVNMDHVPLPLPLPPPECDL